MGPAWVLAVHLRTVVQARAGLTRRHPVGACCRLSSKDSEKDWSVLLLKVVGEEICGAPLTAYLKFLGRDVA